MSGRLRMSGRYGLGGQVTSGWRNSSGAATPRTVKAPAFARVAAAAALLCLAGCGHMGDLKPAKGQSLPPTPIMATTAPSANALLTPPAYANPDRVDELMKKSTPRKSDPFNLPPPTGKAPSLPVQELDNTTSNDLGPSTPQ